MFHPKQNPKQVPSTPPIVSDKEGGMEGQGSSLVVAGDLVIARDEEDGLSFVGRLMAQGGPSGRGKGTVLLVSCHLQPTHLEFQAPGDSIPIPPFLTPDVLTHVPSLTAHELAQYYQSLPTPNTPALESQAPSDSDPTPPFLTSDVLAHVPSLIACEPAQYCQGLPTTNTPALESQAPGDLNPIPPFPTSDLLAHVPSLIACELAQSYQSLPTTNTPALEAVVPKEIAETP